MLAADVMGLSRGGQGCSQAAPSLQPRRVRRRSLAPPDQRQIDIVPGPTGLWATLLQVENDVAAYVTRDQLRQRLRSFVNEALTRLPG
jgi:hypothetical protein